MFSGIESRGGGGSCIGRYLLCLWVKIVWVSGGDYSPLSLVEGNSCMDFAAVGSLLSSLSTPLSQTLTLRGSIWMGYDLPSYVSF